MNRYHNLLASLPLLLMTVCTPLNAEVEAPSWGVSKPFVPEAVRLRPDAAEALRIQGTAARYFAMHNLGEVSSSSDSGGGRVGELCKDFLSSTFSLPVTNAAGTTKPVRVGDWKVVSSTCVGDGADAVGTRIWSVEHPQPGKPPVAFEMRAHDLGVDRWAGIEIAYPPEASDISPSLFVFRALHAPNHWRPNNFYRMPATSAFTCIHGTFPIIANNAQDRAFPSTPEFHWARIHFCQGRQNGGVEWMWRPEEIERITFTRYAQIRLTPKPGVTTIHLALRPFGEAWYERAAVADQTLPEAWRLFQSINFGTNTQQQR
jgi:hypothetical protein